jgi:hydroxymethylbilane synthase
MLRGGYVIRVGTRGSQLAMIQTQRVVEKLKGHIPGLEVEIKVIKTTGDLFLKPRTAGRFVDEINRALINGDIDVGVHSLKDLPTGLHPKIMLACVPERLAPNDVLVSHDGSTLHELPGGSIVGTSSPRRKAEILHIRPDLVTADMRGNVPTRLKDVESRKYDAAVLARAGLERLGLTEKIAQEFNLEEVVPAPGQGALGVVCRRGDEGILDKLLLINDGDAWREVICERTFAGALGLGCGVPIGAVARTAGEEIELIAVVHSNGRWTLRLRGRDPVELGRRAARILSKGGKSRV